jgi:hypothetical protein
MMMSDSQHGHNGDGGKSLFGQHSDNTSRISEELADRDGVDIFGYSGPVGKCYVMSEGCPLQYQAQVALLDAFDEWLNEMVWVTEEDAGSIEQVQSAVKGDLMEQGKFDEWTAEHLAELTADNLRNWTEYHGDQSADTKHPDQAEVGDYDE